MYVLKLKPAGAEYILSDIKCSFKKDDDGRDVFHGEGYIIDIREDKRYLVNYDVAFNVFNNWWKSYESDIGLRDKWETDLENLVCEDIFLRLVTGDLFGDLKDDVIRINLRMNNIYFGELVLKLGQYLRFLEVRREFLEESGAFVFKILD